MRSRRRALRDALRVPSWVAHEVRLWAAAISGTRAARRRRRVAEAETELLVPVSPHVGRAGARHASPDGAVTLRALQRRAMTSFGILLIAAVAGGLTGAVLVWDGARSGPQVVPAENGLVPTRSPGAHPSATTGVDERRDDLPPGRGRANGHLRQAPALMAGVDPTQLPAPTPSDVPASASANPGTPTASPSRSPTQDTAAGPTPSGSATPEPTPTPSDPTTIPGQPSGEGVPGQSAAPSPVFPG